MSTLNHRRGAPLPPTEDYVVAESVGNEAEDLILAPPSGKTPEEAYEELTGLPGYFDPGMASEPEPRRSVLSYSLFEMFAAMTFLCLEVGVASWFPLQASVGVLGIATLAVLFAMTLFTEPASRLWKLALGTLVLSYTIGAVVAAVRMYTG